MSHHYDDIRAMEAGARPARQILSFSVACVPVAQPRQRHRVVKGVKPYAQNYTPATHPVQAFKAALMVAATVAKQGQCPFGGPLDVRLMFRFPLPTSARASVTRHVASGQPWPHSVKPDLDNLIKAAADALTGICWQDDKQIVELSAVKVYAQESGVDVWIGEWEP